MRLPRVAALMVLSTFVLAGCGGGSTDDSQPASAVGETLAVGYRPVLDPLAGNGEAYRLLVPHGWEVTGPGVSWNVGYRNGGVSANLQVTDPSGTRGYGYIPFLPRHWVEPPMFGFPEGSVYGIFGSIVTRPLSAVDYLTLIAVPEGFPQETAILGSQPLPDVARAVAQAQGLANADAARVRISYNNGATDVEAHVYAWISYDTINETTLWSPVGLYVVFAPTGALDREEPLLNSLALSSVVNPDWAQYVRLVEELRISGNQRTQRQMEGLIATLQETQNAIFDYTTEGFRERQEINDRIFQGYTETIRGTETYADPGVGNIELPGGFGEVWATGTGDYILSNDPLFDPNLNSNIDWEQINASR